jgi:hypothetical protein
MSKYFDLKQAAAANAFGANSHIAANSVLKDILHQNVRSPRTRLPLFLYGYTEKETPFFADAWTVHVSVYGASIIVSGAMLQPGQNLIATNKSSEATAACKVVWVTPGPEGNAEVDIEFIEPMPEFWRQPSPRADASTSSASLATAQTSHA